MVAREVAAVARACDVTRNPPPSPPPRVNLTLCLSSGNSWIMARRKLRNCTKCGVRHGPPIGTRCKRAEEEFQKLSEEMGETPRQEREEDVIPQSEEPAEEDSQGAVENTVPGGAEGGDYANPLNVDQSLQEDFSSFVEYRRMREQERRASANAAPSSGEDCQANVTGVSSAGRDETAQTGFYYPAPPGSIPQHLRDRHQYPPVFRGDLPAWHGPRAAQAPSRQEAGQSGPSASGRASERAPNLEGVMELMMESQREQMKLQAEILQSLKASTNKAPVGQQQGGASAANQDLSSSDSETETEEWKAGFGDDLWKNVKGKRDKNPFEQSSYLKKGEPVDSFERVMMVIFKTLRQLLEANGDVRGVVRHGLALAEKASKDVYKVEAFTKYDESVRERAGLVGPSAFGTVDQEDTLRFFSYDNVMRAKSGKASGGEKREHKKKSEKMCLKYNDQGCSAKSCPYAHICAACEEPGHTRKDCKNLKKKDK